MSVFDLKAPADAGKNLIIYQRYLEITQAELARQMGTTPLSVYRWQSGGERITLRTQYQIRAVVERKLSQDLVKAFAEIAPNLTVAEFRQLFGNPPTWEIQKDRNGRVYVGSIGIVGHRTFTLHFSVDDKCLYAIGIAGKARKVTSVFWKRLLKAINE